MGMRFFFERRNRARIEVDPPYEIVGEMIESDVQWNLREAREFRALVRDFMEGRRTGEWEGTGNAWTVILRPEGGFIELAVSDDFEPSGDFPLEVLDEALAGWERLLEPVWDRWEAEGVARRPEGPGWERRADPGDG